MLLILQHSISGTITKLNFLMKSNPNKPSKIDSSPKLQMYIGCLKWAVLILKDRSMHSINLTVELIVKIFMAFDKRLFLKLVLLLLKKLLHMMETELPVSTNTGTVIFATVN